MAKVEGNNNKHSVRMFTISTCGWCKKTKALMKELDVEYEYVDIDQTTGEEAERVDEELKRYNPRRNVPTIIINGGETVIIGFKEDRIREALK